VLLWFSPSLFILFTKFEHREIKINFHSFFHKIWSSQSLLFCSQFLNIVRIKLIFIIFSSKFDSLNFLYFCSQNLNIVRLRSNFIINFTKFEFCEIKILSPSLCSKNLNIVMRIKLFLLVCSQNLNIVGIKLKASFQEMLCFEGKHLFLQPNLDQRTNTLFSHVMFVFLKISKSLLFCSQIWTLWE
jgi:hypothetical protein